MPAIWLVIIGISTELIISSIGSKLGTPVPATKTTWFGRFSPLLLMASRSVLAISDLVKS